MQNKYKAKISNIFSNNRFKHTLAVLTFILLVGWHLKPLFPKITTHVSSGGTFDVYGFVGGPLASARSYLRNPFSFWRGDRLYPYKYSSTLRAYDIPYSFSYYTFYNITNNAILSVNLYALLLFFINGIAVYFLVFYWSKSWLAGIIAGAFCAFFPYKFYSMEYNYQDTYAIALALCAWLAFLRKGTFKYLLLFFIAAIFRMNSPDYQSIFMGLLLMIMVPASFIAYPKRWQKYWLHFLVLSFLTLLILLPFYYPYLVVLKRFHGHGWQGILFENTRMLSFNEFIKVFTNFFHNITHLRTRYSSGPFTPLWPGAIFITTAIISLIWALLSPFFLKRKSVFYIVLVWGVFFTFLFSFANKIPIWNGYTLAKFYVDPPILSVVRGPRAFVFSMTFCLSILIGLAVGDLFEYIKQRGLLLKFVCYTIVILLIVLGTLEHTVKLRSLCSYNKISRLDKVYKWLNQQEYPSPFIEFPYILKFNTFVKDAEAALADQPSAHGRSRYVIPMHYFLNKCNKLSPLEKAELIEVSPYRFWIQRNANKSFRQNIEKNSSINYATNFGRNYVFENPNPERVFPIDIIITQKWPQSFPNVVYSTSVEFQITNRFSFVPEKNRKIVGYFNLLDKDKKSLAKLKIKEELPFILDGPKATFGVHIQYNANKKRLEGIFLRYKPWQIANAPVTTLSISEEDIFKTKFIEIKIKQSEIGNETICLTTVSPAPSRWPYKFGIPTAYCHQAGGFSGIQKKGETTFQLSEGKVSTIYISKPQKVSDYIMLRAKETISIKSKEFYIKISMNGKEIGKLKLEKNWENFKLKIPRDYWKQLNRFDFYYPETVLPCLHSNSNDEKKRCATFAELSLIKNLNLEIQKPVQHEIYETVFTKNLIKNGNFNSKLKNWYYWQTAKNNKSFLNISEESGKNFLRICNPKAKLIGLVQNIKIEAGKVYKLSGDARSAKNTRGKLFGGRIGFYIPNQKEKQIVWMTENNKWQKKNIVFTNEVDATASIFVHLGYGNISTTGDFKNISFQEQVTRISQPGSLSSKKTKETQYKFSNIVHRISSGKTNEYPTVFAAFRKCKSNDKIIIYPGIYHEKNPESEWLISYKKNVKIIGKENPQIIVNADTPGYQISMQLPYNTDLIFDGIRLKTIANVSNNKVIYNAVFTGGKNIKISNCVFEIELNGTNSVCKNVVAVNNATNVVICNSEIITLDNTGNNQIYHFASHDASPLEIRNVTLHGKNLKNLCIGKIRQTNCKTISE